jgi:predicted phage terminase large subunit-like protein
MFRELTYKWPKAFKKLVEDKANGTGVEDILKKQISGIKLVNPEGGKIARATACEPAIDSGSVYLPDPALYSWVEPFIEESTSFPNAKNDDQVDAASQAIYFLHKKSNLALYKLIKL